MPILRAAGSWFGRFLFTTFLLLAIIALTFSQFTEPTTLRPMAIDTFTNQLSNNTQFNDMVQSVVSTCNSTGQESLTIPAPEMNLTFKCADLLSTSDPAKAVTGTMFDAIYYRTYPCSFFDCLKNGIGIPQIFFSEGAHGFLLQVVPILFFIAMVGAALVIVSIREPFEILKSLGWGLIVTGVPYIYFLFFPFIVPSQVSFATGLVALLMSVLSENFKWVLISGIALTAIGYAGGLLIRRKKK
jgi:hypothetical protein